MRGPRVAMRVRALRSPASARIRRASAAPVSLALQQHLRGARCGQRLGILPLVVVGRGWQRNQNRRLARGRDLGQRRRARAADDHIRVPELFRPMSYRERLDFGRQSRRSR